MNFTYLSLLYIIYYVGMSLYLTFRIVVLHTQP